MTYLLQVSTCWIVFYAIYILFLQRETFFSINRYYLLGALAAGLLIPFLGTLVPANQTSTEIYYVMSQVSAVEITPTVEPVVSSFNWMNLLYLIYTIGASIVFMRLVYGLLQIFKIYQASVKTKLKHYILVESSKFHLPFSFFKFIFISKKLPLNEDVERVLKHEELHANQWHSLDVLFAEILQIFFWFNPILIFYKKALKQSHEYLADAYVTRDHNRSSYGQLLLRQSTSGLEIALANQFFHSQIKKRITMMYKEKSKRPAMVKYLAAIPVLIGLLVIFASSKTIDQTIENTDTSCLEITQSKEGKYSHNGKIMSLQQIGKLSEELSKDCILLSVEDDPLTYEVHALFDKDESLFLYKGSEDKALKDRCLSIEVTSSNEVVVDKKKYTVTELENFMKSLYMAKCVNLDASSVSNTETVSQVLKILSKKGLTVNVGPLKAVEKKDKIVTEPFNGRKIIQRGAPVSLNTEGIIAVDTEVNAAGDMIFGQINLEKTTIENTEAQQKILKSIRKYKLEPGSGNAKGQLIFNYSTINGKIATVTSKAPLSSDEEAQKESTSMLDLIKASKELFGIAENLNEDQGDPIFKVVEEMPRFPGCEDFEGSIKEKDQCAKQKMLEHLYANLKYPRKAKEQFIEGMTVVQFVVEKDGTISNVNLLRDIGGGCGEVSVGVVKNMPKWIPGKQRGETVRVQYTLPLKFKLEEDKLTDEQKESMINVIGFGESSEEAKKDNLKTSTIQSRETQDLFKVVEEMPRFPGCEDQGTSEEIDACSKQKMLEFIYRNIKYPKEARNLGIDGIAIIQLVIEKDGSVTAAKILRDPGAGTGEEAKRVIESMPNWIPGKQRGQHVRVQMVIPIKYKLQGGETKKKGVEVKEVPRAEDLKPLIVVNGKIVNSISTDDVNPDDIKSINVLKDGKAIEKYGKKGEHGVIEIFLKEGKLLNVSKKETNEVVEVMEVAREVDQKPLFPGTSTEKESTEGLLNFVFKNMLYPKEAAQNGIEGTAIVKFIIDKEGIIQKINLAKSPGWGIDEVVLELMDKMKSLDEWTPAVLNNKDVGFEYVLPIKFKLQENQIEESKTRKLNLIDYSVSPNPTTGVVSLKFSSENNAPADVVLYSSVGQVLRTFKNLELPYSKSIDLSEFRGQTVYMNIIQGDKIFSDKIIIQ